MSRIIVTGAAGFIGRHIVATLLARRHTVVGLHRGPTPPSLAGHPRFESVRTDLAAMTTPEAWADILLGADAVINCAGLLQASKSRMKAVHTTAPQALFKACIETGVKRVVQISAISADADTAYARTKRDADTTLIETDLDWVVVRPSLVYGHGSYGGTSVIRGLAACPGAMPLPGDGSQTFQPICMEDLVGIICELCEATSFNRVIIEPVGPEVLTLKDILLKLRHWLDIRGERTLSVPTPIVRLVTTLGDVLRWPVINSTAFTQMIHGNAATADSFRGLYAPGASKMDDVLTAHPSTVQDRWHARQVFLAPFITAVLALLWIMSGVLGALRGAPLALETLQALGWNVINPVVLTWISSGWDVALGFLLLLPLGTRLLTVLQGITVTGYTIVLSITVPMLWLDPLGPLLKNIPILLLICLWATVRHKR